MTFGGLNGVIISAESQTATNAKIYREQSEANRKMNLSFISFLQPDFLLISSLFHLSPPFTAS